MRAVLQMSKSGFGREVLKVNKWVVPDYVK